MIAILCEYKNGLFGEVINYSNLRDNGNMESYIFNDSSIKLTHSLNGKCNNISVDNIYRQTFMGRSAVNINNVHDFEIMKLVILKSKTICKLADIGTSDKFINVENIKKENQKLVKNYLKYRNITLKDIFNDFKYNTSLSNILEGE